ncbi:MAG: VTT domain-containing protein [Oligoflexia bacterium]|nr:VTT domain-containing protein [Oligoflexia bacterium]
MRGFYHVHPVLAPLICGALEVVLLTLAVPGAGVVDIAAGAVLGFWPAFLVVWISSVIGSVTAFMAGRYFLRNWVEERLGDKAQQAREGFERHGGLYLLSLRFIPFLPHFLLNFGVALTHMKLRDFAWATAIGILPAVWALVNAGTAIARIHSLDDVMTFQTMLALCGLGVLPILALASSALLKRFDSGQ